MSLARSSRVRCFGSRLLRVKKVRSRVTAEYFNYVLQMVSAFHLPGTAAIIIRAELLALIRNLHICSRY